MIGTKLITVPTPPNTPSTTSERTASLTCQRSIAPSATPASHWIP